MDQNSGVIAAVSFAAGCAILAAANFVDVFKTTMRVTGSLFGIALCIAGIALCIAWLATGQPGIGRGLLYCAAVLLVFLAALSIILGFAIGSASGDESSENTTLGLWIGGAAIIAVAAWLANTARRII